MISFVIEAIVKATLVCGLAFFVAHVCRRARASIRHMVFALAFAALAIIPAAMLLVPTIAITVPVQILARAEVLGNRATAQLKRRATGAETAQRRTRPTGAVPTATVPGTKAVPARSTSFGTAATLAVTTAQVATLIWVTGVALFLMPVAAGLWQVHRLRKTATPWTQGQEVIPPLASSLGVRRQIDGLLHDAVTGPMTCGIFRPAIILPGSARQWDGVSIRCAIRHELEHVARWDFPMHCLSRMVCAAYWFHPLVWVAWRRLRLESERACDDAVLSGNDPNDYASLLVSMARVESTAMRRPQLAMAGRDDLAARVASLLNGDQMRGRIGRRRTTGFIVMGAIVILGVGAITVAREMPQTVPRLAATPALRFESVSLKRNRDGDWRQSRLFLSEHAGGRPGVGSDGRVQWLTATNVPARLLLWSAFGDDLRPEYGTGGMHQVDNAPEWIDSDLFDVVAKAPSGSSRQQMHEMAQSMLVDRFNLVAHVESKDFPIYALARSRSDGNLGPRMSPSQVDCAPKPNASSPCGLASSTGRLTARGVTMSQLVKALPNHLGGAHHIGLDRPLIDKTDVSGAFDFTLEWTPDPREVRSPTEPRLFQFRPFDSPVESKAPNFLGALQEQLGLMLANQWAPEPVLVIDRIEPPTEN